MDEQEGILYRALKPLTCRRCGTGIVPGDSFVRRLHKGDAYKVSAVCGGCVGPFEPIERPH